MSVTGERLRTLRKERGLLQREVAKEIGLDRLNYGKYERGQVKSPRKMISKKSKKPNRTDKTATAGRYVITHLLRDAAGRRGEV